MPKAAVGVTALTASVTEPANPAARTMQPIRAEHAPPRGLIASNSTRSPQDAAGRALTRLSYHVGGIIDEQTNTPFWALWARPMKLSVIQLGNEQTATAAGRRRA